MFGIMQSQSYLIKTSRIIRLIWLAISLLAAATVFTPKAGGYEYHWIEAEYPNTLTAPFRVGSDTHASEGHFLYTPNGADTGAESTYRIAVSQGGQYILFGRQFSPLATYDAFTICIDDGALYNLGSTQAVAWTWNPVNDGISEIYYNAAPPATFYLTAGIHTIAIHNPKANIKLDKLLLTNNRDFSPQGIGYKAGNIIPPKCSDTICSDTESCSSCPQPQDCFCPQATSCSQVPSTILFCEDFESGSFASDFFKLTCCSYSTEVQQTIIRNGGHALKTTLLYHDRRGWSPQRAEIGLEDSRTGKIGDTRWYGFSVFVPEDYVADHPINREIFFQLLMHPYLNEHQKSPQFDFQIKAEMLQIENRYSIDSDPNVTKLEILYKSPMSALRGKWTDWKIYAKWSDKSDGRLKVWQNGILVLDKLGANSYAGTGNRVFETKFGIYKWSWFIAGRPTFVDKRVIYHDNFRIGSPDATYNDMITD